MKEEMRRETRRTETRMVKESGSLEKEREREREKEREREREKKK